MTQIDCSCFLGALSMIIQLDRGYVVCFFFELEWTKSNFLIQLWVDELQSFYTSMTIDRSQH